MEVISRMVQGDYEQVVFCQDREAGLRAIIAIHSTALGPALGGVRMWPYGSEEEALFDVLRLARGMTYKNALAGLSLGGGKAVILGDPSRDKGEALLRAFGRFVDSLGGRYITAEDVGTSQQDMDVIRQVTRHVVGVSGGSGDPSPFTALGVFYGMKAAAKRVFGRESLAGLHVVVQGVGNVGLNLCRLLAREGARLTISDINTRALTRAMAELKANVVPPEEVYGVECDIFSPCALGGVVNDKTLPLLRCRIIAGAANNVLLEERHGEALHAKGILYVPDYVINAGGVINVAEELQGYQRRRVEEKVARIYHTVERVLELAAREGIPPFKAADRLTEERLLAARQKSQRQRGEPGWLAG
ncbi:Glu/Leu/Phe/Val dehydrogenase dimerization domain-containing protein [Desulfovirgula thermocuniculi]|uniref:Glu/Leu/Phe/Val dehydrogenase dimerization domain-containing protein n=1 Tax=Desulfovirgula thermocuniculi TaxID=348842 RepID=UPI0004072042